jgi:hypothetical protein
MSLTDLPRPRVFVDADVLSAGAASPSEQVASLVVLRMAEINLIDAVASEQVIVEVERNLAEKLPHKLPDLRLLTSRCLRVVPDPGLEELAVHAGTANVKDLPILVAAVCEGCAYLITHNVRHFQPGHPDVDVLSPGELVLRVRELLAHLEPDIA